MMLLLKDNFSSAMPKHYHYGSRTGFIWLDVSNMLGTCLEVLIHWPENHQSAEGVSVFPGRRTRPDSETARLYDWTDLKYVLFPTLPQKKPLSSIPHYSCLIVDTLWRDALNQVICEFLRLELCDVWKPFQVLNIMKYFSLVKTLKFPSNCDTLSHCWL